MDIGTNAAADERIDRIRLLARKLEATALTTARSKARCGNLALEILELLNDADAQNAQVRVAVRRDNRSHCGGADRVAHTVERFGVLWVADLLPSSGPSVPRYGARTLEASTGRPSVSRAQVAEWEQPLV